MASNIGVLWRSSLEFGKKPQSNNMFVRAEWFQRTAMCNGVLLRLHKDLNLSFWLRKVLMMLDRPYMPVNN
jgi:hypothetical protein